MSERKSRDRIAPRLLKGFKDYSPEEEIARQLLIEKTKTVYERYGFLPLQTASLEFAEALLGPHYTDDNLKELFGFCGPEDVDMALRYEFTLSLARYVAGNPHLPLPFRRYQYGNVWRVDKPGPGRFREFMQFDLDIVGTSGMLADAEILAVMAETLDCLGIRNFIIRYSNRKLINGLVSFAGVPPEKAADVFKVIDKLERQGREAVLQELGPGRTDKSGDKITGLYLTDRQIALLEKFLDLAMSDYGDTPGRLEDLLGDIEISREGIKELREISEYLRQMNIGEGKCKIDITIVRGLGYYSGPVYETTLLDLPDYGSVFSGGRYDDLVGRFSSRSIPATGSSFGVDRMLAALLALESLELKKATAEVIVTTMDKARTADYIKMAGQIRESGINAELFMGDTRNINKQLRYADRVGIPIAVIAGSVEFESDSVTVKDLRAGNEKSGEIADRKEWLKADDIQVTIKREDLIPYLKKALKKQ
jgi:histidyl-tRNA synthetase